MASPFTIFRRHQKVMLAVVGIGAMIAFVFLDPLMQFMGSSNRPGNPVVVETRYGDLKESELVGLRQSRELVEAFLRVAISATIETLVKNNSIDPRSANFIAENHFVRARNQLMMPSGLGPEESAVETMILAEKARQLGIVVSDRAINDYLQELTFDSLSSETLEQLVHSLQVGRRVSVLRLFEALRTEMLASRLKQMFLQSVSDVPPAQRFEYYSRLNRRAKAEILPLAVADFTSQVKNPSDAVLEKFFDEHKNRLPDASSPDPGFLEPQRAAFQYFKADFVKFRDQFKPDVTEEEIRAYYDANREQFRVLSLPGDPGAPGADEPAEGEPAQESPGEATDEPAKEADAEKSDAEKPAEDKPAEPEASADSPAEPEAAKPESEPADKPADETKSDDPQSGVDRARTFRLASVELNAQDEPAAEAKSDDAKADEPENEPAVPADSEKPAEEKPATQTPAASDKPAQPDEEAPASADKPGEPAPGETPAAAGDAATTTPPEPQYDPLEKVQDQIRDTLAGQKAIAQINEIFDNLQAQMRRYSDELDIYSTRKETDPSAQPPKPLPLAELAQQYNLEAKELPLTTLTDATNEDIGKTFRADSFPRQPFIDFSFSESFALYKATVVEDNEGNRYLVWKTDERASYVPKFAQVHDKVLAAWKMIEARSIARKRADELAKQALDADQPLKEVFANQPDFKVIETGSFSWMTMGNVPQDFSAGQPRISQIDGVQYIDDTFMEVVFGLDAGQVGVAMNHPQDTAYVVRLAEYEQPIDELRDDFAKENPSLYLAVAAPDQRQIYQTWLENISKEADVHWLRPADAPRGRVADASSDMSPDEL